MAITRTLHAISGATLAAALVLASAPTAAADDVRDKQWPLKTLNAQAIWKITKGKGQTVAVIDVGVDPTHADLKGNVLKGKDFLDGDSNKPEYEDNHGTSMASLIAGHGHGPGNSEGIMGLAPEAKILPLRDDSSGPGGGGTSIRYAVEHGASVINISLGGESSAPQEEAITYALNHDVLVVAATGNNGGKVDYPAANPGLVAVGGVNEDGTIWNKSNYGPQTLLSAPATKILSAGAPTNPKGYRIAGGTSDAAAFTSASAALLRAKYPDLTAGQIANRLTKTAGLPGSEKGLKLPDEKYGYGFIQPLDALTKDIPKGSKYGPLSVPQAIKDEQQAEADQKDSAALQEKSDQEAMIAWSVIGVVGLLCIGIVALIIVRIRRKKNRPNGPSGQGGWGPPPSQAPGYGQPPHQQQPSYNPYSGQLPPRN